MSILDNSRLNIFSSLYPGRPGSKMQKVPSKEKRKESAKPKEKVCNSINYSSEKFSELRKEVFPSRLCVLSIFSLIILHWNIGYVLMCEPEKLTFNGNSKPLF